MIFLWILSCTLCLVQNGIPQDGRYDSFPLTYLSIAFSLEANLACTLHLELESTRHDRREDSFHLTYLCLPFFFEFCSALFTWYRIALVMMTTWQVSFNLPLCSILHWILSCSLHLVLDSIPHDRRHGSFPFTYLCEAFFIEICPALFTWCSIAFLIIGDMTIFI
jgi:hypothetical protein